MRQLPHWKKPLKEDLEAIEAKTKELTEASTPLVQRMYAEAQAAGAEGAADDAAGSGSDDDAVDAEFEEVEEESKEEAKEDEK